MDAGFALPVPMFEGTYAPDLSSKPEVHIETVVPGWSEAECVGGARQTTLTSTVFAIQLVRTYCT